MPNVLGGYDPLLMNQAQQPFAGNYATNVPVDPSLNPRPFVNNYATNIPVAPASAPAQSGGFLSGMNPNQQQALFRSVLEAGNMMQRQADPYGQLPSTRMFSGIAKGLDTYSMIRKEQKRSALSERRSSRLAEIGQGGTPSQKAGRLAGVGFETGDPNLAARGLALQGQLTPSAPRPERGIVVDGELRDPITGALRGAESEPKITTRIIGSKDKTGKSINLVLNLNQEGKEISRIELPMSDKAGVDKAFNPKFYQVLLESGEVFTLQVDRNAPDAAERSQRALDQGFLPVDDPGSPIQLGTLQRIKPPKVAPTPQETQKVTTPVGKKAPSVSEKPVDISETGAALPRGVPDFETFQAAFKEDNPGVTDMNVILREYNAFIDRMEKKSIEKESHKPQDKEAFVNRFLTDQPFRNLAIKAWKRFNEGKIPIKQGNALAEKIYERLTHMGEGDPLSEEILPSGKRIKLKSIRDSE